MTIKEQERTIDNLKLEMRRLNHDQSEIKERINVLEINNKYLHLTIENIPEAKNTEPREAIIQRLNEDLESKLSVDLIKSAHRIGKFKPKARYPRQIKFIVSEDKARSAILACRGKLKPNKNNSIVWINETYPEEYRRRKVMLRYLVKKINSKGDYTASIESRGIKVGDQLYQPNDFMNCHTAVNQTLSNRLQQTKEA